MLTKKMIISFFICLLITLFASRTLSQTRIHENSREVVKPESWTQQWQKMNEQRRQQWQIENEKRIEQLQKQSRIESKKRSAESMRQALQATKQQWKVIKPRLDRVKYLSKQARVSITPQSYKRSRGSGGSPNNQQSVARVEEGWKWTKVWEKKASAELTEGERICEELLELLEDKGSKQEEIEQKIEVLREERKKAGIQLAKAQQELRQHLNLRQEATLVLLGWL